jgi:hypothetical protein
VLRSTRKICGAAASAEMSPLFRVHFEVKTAIDQLESLKSLENTGIKNVRAIVVTELLEHDMLY